MITLLLGLISFQVWAILHTVEHANDHADDVAADKFLALLDLWRREDLAQTGRYPSHVILRSSPRLIRKLHRALVAEEQQKRELRRVVEARIGRSL